MRPWTLSLLAPGGRGRPATSSPRAGGAGRPPAVLFLNWRDTGHPEGGGSELYVETVAASLAARGHDVTIFCAEYGDAPRQERRDGVRFVRRGGRFSVYLFAALSYLTGRLGRPGVIVDVQNGVPFWTPLFSRRPVVALVHHVHREQWDVVFPRHLARLGWFLESRVAPRVYRRAAYVAVSEVTRAELAGLGVRADRVAVVHNGVVHPAASGLDESADPLVTVLGRLVPHKRVELAIESIVALRAEMPTARLLVVGQGYWEPWLRAAVERLDAGDIVEMTGFVDERTKHEILARSWAVAMPSLKEGWGLTVMEGAVHGTPAVAFRAAGGLAESVTDGVTGLLADDHTEFTAHLRRLLTDHDLRHRMGAAAARRAEDFTWAATAEAFATVIDLAYTGVRVPAGTLA